MEKVFEMGLLFLLVIYQEHLGNIYKLVGLVIIFVVIVE